LVGPAARLLAVVALFGALSYFVDLRQAVARALSLSPAAFALCAGVLVVQTILAGLRWRVVSIACRSPLPAWSAVRIFTIGQFFGQFLPSSVGGDAIRMVLVRRFTRSLSGAVSLVVNDRLIALVSAVLLITLVSPLTLSTVAAEAPYEAVAAALLAAFYAGLGLTLVFGGRILRYLRRWPRLDPALRLVADFLLLCWNRRSPAILALSLIVHGLMVVAIGLALWRLDAPATWVQLAAVGPWIIVCAMLPISVSSWGVREASMVIWLGLLGIQVEQALAASLTVAAGQVVVALIGMALWLAMGAPRATPQTAAEAATGRSTT